jgi:hypothetical protein
LVLMSRVNEASEFFLRRQPKLESSKSWRSRVQSLPPLRMYVGQFFYVLPLTLLTFLSTLLENVITLSLTFGKFS